MDSPHSTLLIQWRRGRDTERQRQTEEKESSAMHLNVSHQGWRRPSCHFLSCCLLPSMVSSQAGDPQASYLLVWHGPLDTGLTAPPTGRWKGVLPFTHTVDKESIRPAQVTPHNCKTDNSVSWILQKVGWEQSLSKESLSFRECKHQNKNHLES